MPRNPRMGEVRASRQVRANCARMDSDVAACEAWDICMKGYGGPVQPSPLLGDALSAGYRYLEGKCDGCNTDSAVDPDHHSTCQPRNRQMPMALKLCANSSA